MRSVPRIGFAASPALRGRRCCRGFTLVEMLVVLLLMGLLTGAVRSVVQADDRSVLQVEVARLVQLMNLAEAESQQSGKAIAWTADGPGYRFWRFSEDLGWSRIVDDPLLRARTLPRGMTLSRMQIESAQPSERMRVEFTSHGPTASFTVDMSLGASRYTMAASPTGAFTVLPAPAVAAGASDANLPR